MSKLQGTVKFFNGGKGFGFITPSNGDKDVFVHITNLDAMGGYLQEGQTVSFEVQQGKKGLEERLLAMKTLCTFLMSNKQGLNGQVSLRPSETKLRYKIIRDRNKERRIFQNVPQTLISASILPSIDGVCAESKCNIFINKNHLNTSYDIILEGSWRV